MQIVIAEQSAELARTWQLSFRDVRRTMVLRCEASEFLSVVGPDATVAYMVNLNQRYGDQRVTEHARVLPVRDPDDTLPPQVVTIPGRLWLKLLGNAPTRQPDNAPLPIAQQYAYESFRLIFVALCEHNAGGARPVRMLGFLGEQRRALFRYRGPEDYLIPMARLAYENVLAYSVATR